MISLLPPGMSKGTCLSTSPITYSVMGQKATKARPPATHRPRYNAGITFFSPGLAFTHQVPRIEATIEKPPRTRG